jgi:hypothetical protein
MNQKKWNWGVLLLGGLMVVSVSSCLTRDADEMGKGEEGGQEAVRIGVYDSRSIAVAYAGSAAHERELEKLAEGHARAKAQGDAEEVARLEAQGKAKQEKMHRQAFGTAAVEDILATIAEEAARLAERVDVELFLSKWDEGGLEKYPGAEQVDVTLDLVDLLEPTEQQRKRAMEIRAMDPVE